MISFSALSAAVSTTAGMPVTGAAGVDWTRAIIQLAAIVFIFYLFFIRPQQRRTKEHLKLVSSLNVGDEVLVGGFIGKVSALTNEAEVMVELDKNVNVKVLRSFISQVMIEKSCETQSKKQQKVKE